MNYKAIGEKAQNCVIGDFAKWNLNVAIPLSDNLPFDLIVCAAKLYRVQIKASTTTANGSIVFDLSTNNWHAKTIKKYTQEDCDAMALYDLNNYVTYLLGPKNFVNRKSFSIRLVPTKNGQNRKCNWHENYVLGEKRIKEVFDV